MDGEADTTQDAPINWTPGPVHDARESPSESAPGSLLSALNGLFRKAINQIADGTRLLAECQLPPELSQVLARIDDSTKSMSQLMNLVMDQWMIDVGSLRPESVDFELRTTLGEARRSVARMARESENDLVTRLDSAAPGSLRGDPSRLRQIIFDLAEFVMGRVRGGIIQWQCVREAEDENQVTLRVSFATAPGRIDPEVARRAFEVDGLDIGAQGQLAGSELGLYHARLLARTLGGDAGYEQNADRLLLWARVVLHKCREDNPELEARSGRGVLFVSSSPKEVRTIVGVLQEGGWDARGATTQEEALTVLRESVSVGQPCGLILVTLVLPDGSAEQLAREAFSILGEARVHVAVLADVGRPGDAEWARGVGFSAYLVRPLNPRTAHSVLSALLNHRQRRGGDTRGIFLTRHSLAERNERSLWVLVVDDDLITRRSITSAVQSLGHEVFAAENAAQALELHDKVRFDLVLMDIKMLEQDGDQVASIIRSRERTLGQRRTSIIGMTTGPGPDDRERCLGSGMDDLLPKPIGVDVITNIIDSMNPEEALVSVWQPPGAHGYDAAKSKAASEEAPNKPSLADIMGFGLEPREQKPDEAPGAAAA